MSKIKETCPTCGSLCERINESFRACCACKAPIGNLVAVDYSKIQAKPARRKKALKQLNRAVAEYRHHCEWQRLELRALGPEGDVLLNAIKTEVMGDNASRYPLSTITKIRKLINKSEMVK